jgi:molecular chaperone HtpG
METLKFETDTSRLLNLVIHSLYTQREIFLRELISNASDALDRLRLESYSQPSLLDATPLEIHLEVDSAARTLTVRDNGIGMNREEVVAHIGTIARSGTRQFEAALTARQAGQPMHDLIGRFGVGFYSCFMVADRVTLLTRRAGDAVGTRWQSAGDVEYTLTDAGDVPHGTSVTLHLKPVDHDTGIEDYTHIAVLTRIIKRYADFVTYPIVWIGAPNDKSAVMSANGGRVLNSMKPIWTKAAADVAEDEYAEFYKHITHDWTEPLLHWTFRAEGRWEYAALLFVPSHAPHDLYYHATPYGLQLYSQRVLILEACPELVPRYLRFLKGVVDAADLPLNVSRQALQEAHHLTRIRQWLTRKVIDALAKLREMDAEKYLTLWRGFGRALKEGVSEDEANRDRLTPLLLFQSSFDDTKLTTFSEYVSRMKPGQTDIYYATGASPPAIEHSPHLEEVRARDYEVLYFTEAVDELLAQALGEYEGHRLRSVAKGQLELGDTADRERAEREANEHAAQLGDLLAGMASHLGGRVRGVRVSKRLTVSPACLTGEEFDYSPQIQRMLKDSGLPYRRTLELNPKHAIVQHLRRRFEQDRTDAIIALAADVLLGLATLAEGTELSDSATFTTQVADLLAWTVAAQPDAAIR